MNTVTDRQRDLPSGLDLQFPLRWLDDESLFSLCSRYHRYAVSPNARQTALALFGDRHGGHAHDLPSHLDALVSRTRGAIGGAQELICQHTIAPFFLPFRSSASGELMQTCMRGQGIGSLKFHLGLLTSRFRASHPLKACRVCMQEDVECGLPPYWRLSHQFPGVWICERHNEVLFASELKATGVDRFGFHLPDEGLPRMSRDLQHESSVLQVASLLALGRTCKRLGCTAWGTHFHPQRLVRAFAIGLSKAGFLEPSGRLRGREACHSLAAYSQPFGLIEELKCLVVTKDTAYAQIRNLRSEARILTHPLRHVFLINWIFGGWDAFLRAYACADVAAALDVRSSQPKDLELETFTSAPEPHNIAKRRLCLKLMKEQDFAPTRAARAVGVATATAMAWAAAAGIGVQRRPKSLGRADRARALSALRHGADKSAVAKRHSMSRSAVEVMLHTEPGLYEAWSSVRQRLELGRRRRQWLTQLKANPGLPVKQLRGLWPATYAWLYRNDREWLIEQRQSAVRPKSNNAASIDWQERDRLLAAAVETRCSPLLQGNRSLRASRSIALWEIYQLVPELKAKLRQLGRMPDTRAAVERLRGKPLDNDPGW